MPPVYPPVDDLCSRGQSPLAPFDQLTKASIVYRLPAVCLSARMKNGTAAGAGLFVQIRRFTAGIVLVVERQAACPMSPSE